MRTLTANQQRGMDAIGTLQREGIVPTVKDIAGILHRRTTNVYPLVRALVARGAIQPGLVHLNGEDDQPDTPEEVRADEAAEVAWLRAEIAGEVLAKLGQRWARAGKRDRRVAS